MEVAPFFVSIFKKRSQDFLHGIKLYKERHKSKHDLNSDMVNLLHDYRDMVEEFEIMLKDEEEKASRPLPEHMEEALLFVRLCKKSLKGFLNCDMVDLLRNLQDLVAEFESILADEEEKTRALPEQMDNSSVSVTALHSWS